MSTCGYICPKCEGRNYDGNGIPCNWCFSKEEMKAAPEESTEEWIRKVHEGPCCSDFSGKSEGL